MERPTEIGSSIVVKGDITTHEDIVVSGRVDGSIAALGHAVTVNAGAELLADIQARAVVVSGQVLGTICALMSASSSGRPRRSRGKSLRLRSR